MEYVFVNKQTILIPCFTLYVTSISLEIRTLCLQVEPTSVSIGYNVSFNASSSDVWKVKRPDRLIFSNNKKQKNIIKEIFLIASNFPDLCKTTDQKRVPLHKKVRREWVIWQSQGHI